MFITEIVLIFFLLIVFYTYIGYGIIVLIINKLTSKYKVTIDSPNNQEIPSITVLVAAYNEEDCIEEKIINTLSLEYPKNLIQYIFITDGSTDGTNQMINNYPKIKLLYEKKRKGKIAATKRAMKYVTTEIVVFTDANTIINRNALLKIVKHYNDPKVGGVACEKKVRVRSLDSASGAGEGIYWKYESFLKKQDSRFYSVVGAAGELFSIRTRLFEDIPSDSIIEDFYLTMKIAQRGFTIHYEPEAYALEEPSLSVREEYKRKTRIAAGGIQSIIRLRSLLNPFKLSRLSFLYISHRVLRWSITPMLLLLILILSIPGALAGSPFSLTLLLLQILFYTMAFIGLILSERKIKTKIFYIPFYFSFMNIAVFVGAFKYFTGQQSVIWDKAKRL